MVVVVVDVDCDGDRAWDQTGIVPHFGSELEGEEGEEGEGLGGPRDVGGV